MECEIKGLCNGGHELVTIGGLHYERDGLGTGHWAVGWGKETKGHVPNSCRGENRTGEWAMDEIAVCN